ncbi:hypothetical protein K466DRAFT_659614 [Polyporus arcularius HHB13444]|uniref:Uncharacterized protein n=1 Tax=Polyporus arcularius HHB13444 TaxID=1314778 RepID=A0A5C3PQ99_9APHY|nr:hypothetical protein K466DRAFT_659614 [Polyporus arcularius HHB13444]
MGIYDNTTERSRHAMQPMSVIMSDPTMHYFENIMVRRLIPSPLHYLAIQMNPTAMLEDLGLDDSATMAEARAIRTKTYLVHLVWPGELPVSRMRWCRYQVEPIGTTLRTEVPEQGITADMVLPIAPNTAEARGIQPVTPNKPFPFPNCYHWLENSVVVRIRVPHGGFEHDGAFSLTREERNLMNEKFAPDRERIASFLDRQEKSPPAPSPSVHATRASTPLDAFGTTIHSQSGFPDPQSVPSTAGIPVGVLSDAYLRIVKEKGVMTSTPSKRPRGTAGSSKRRRGTLGSDTQGRGATAAPSPSNLKAGEIVEVFGRAPDPITPMIPLVDAWLDIENHLTADTIADPREFEKEVQLIVRIIKRGIARQLLSEEARRDALDAAYDTQNGSASDPSVSPMASRRGVRGTSNHRMTLASTPSDDAGRSDSDSAKDTSDEGADQSRGDHYASGMSLFWHHSLDMPKH